MVPLAVFPRGPKPVQHLEHDGGIVADRVDDLRHALLGGGVQDDEGPAARPSVACGSHESL
jgi:hypothetical protein